MTVGMDVLKRIETAHRYSEMFLADIEGDQWYRQPSEGVTNLIWQLGHLAAAQYALGIERIRGPLPESESILPENFRPRYGKGSVPSPDPVQNQTPAELRAIRQRVHERVLALIPDLSAAELDEPPHLGPHPMFKTKLECLEWCAGHELVHAGQIALLRRFLGKQPLR